MKDIFLVLASGSRYRAELLGRLGIAFETWSPSVDETPVAGESCAETARRLARAKAQAAVDRFPGAWAIGSDQVAELDGRPIGKPGNRDNARRQLQAMRGRTVVFHTGVCLLANGRAHESLVPTAVTFRDLADAEIERYLDREPAFDCAGSAKSEALGIALIASLKGDDPTALVGLPLIALSAMLRSEGAAVP
ncbi:MAG: Maf family nucleotide pyrophosphatase [Betaproteobacteria bacterium]|nr:Maf family nucleotide pyrophosphatase [Betaproteobacteria bacterium]